MPDSLGQLFWGNDPATGLAWSATSLEKISSRGDAPAFAAAMAAASEWVKSGDTVPVVSQIHIEGRLPSEPGFQESVNALRASKILVPLALCARIGSPEIRAQCRQCADEGVFRWIRAYSRPTGNPVDESGLLPLFLAMDLLSSGWSPQQTLEVQRWLQGFLSASRQFMQIRMRNSADTHADNWQSWRLMLALLASTIARDKPSVEGLTAQWHAQLAANLGADGRTWDLRRRGALHYQVYDLEPMVWLRLLVPSAFSAQDRDLLEGALTYLRPYVEGKRQFVEFANPDPSLGPAVTFDKVRGNAGVSGFQHTNWDPSDARQLLHLASTLYPRVAEWAPPGKEDQYSLMVRWIVATHSQVDKYSGATAGTAQ